ncbi:thioredoxin family protein [Oerskovia flava]|uniref:thioredoxin family protein n=1 Tax=Oerskovia flava TaxID=2986422 RepID=UPI00223F0B00|nr:thioredoxin family protein [Oerskovia sp. JB1-3-2]
MIERVVVLLAVLAVSAVLGLWWQRRQGAVRTRHHHNPADDDGFDWLAHGVNLGAHRTFVQFSSAVCSPCRQTARVLTELASARPDVTHRELDVDDHHELVRDFGVLRTPTVLVLDATGHELARMSGAVDRAHALQALAAAPNAGDPQATEHTTTRSH